MPRRSQFFERVAPILLDIVRDRGAAVLMDSRAVLLSADRVDVTEAAIAAIDAALGEGGADPIISIDIDAEAAPGEGTTPPEHRGPNSIRAPCRPECHVAKPALTDAVRRPAVRAVPRTAKNERAHTMSLDARTEMLSADIQMIQRLLPHRYPVPPDRQGARHRAVQVRRRRQERDL
jgi:hypothetical protein